MKKIALALLLIPAPAFAQAGDTVRFPSAAQPNPCIYMSPFACTGIGRTTPMPTGVLETFQLVAANVPSAAANVFGGNYILSQTCTTYGTLALQVLGPDGVTWQTVLSKTSSDAAGGTGLALGSYAQVRATVTGTTGCNALLARVPA